MSLLLRRAANRNVAPEIPPAFYQPGGFYFAPDRKKKRREVIDDAVEQAVEIVVSNTAKPHKEIDPNQVAAIAAQLRRVIPKPVESSGPAKWQADHQAIMAAIDLEIARLIDERRRADDEFTELAWLLLMAA